MHRPLDYRPHTTSVFEIDLMGQFRIHLLPGRRLWDYLTVDGTWTYTWEHGRQLQKMSNGTTEWTFTYDADGMRTGRTNGTTTYGYVYNIFELLEHVLGGST